MQIEGHIKESVLESKAVCSPQLRLWRVIILKGRSTFGVEGQGGFIIVSQNIVPCSFL